MPSPDSLYAAIASKTYSSFGADIDLRTEIPTGLTAPLGIPCRKIRINNATNGVLSVEYANGAQDAPPYLNSGDEIIGQIRKIRASGTSNVSSITVYW